MEKIKIRDIKDNVLEVKYKGKSYSINISEELSLDEKILNRQLKDSPSNYEFLCHLKDQACRKRDNLEREKDAVFSQVWLYFKESDNRMSNEAATHRATSNQKYQSYLKKYIRADYMANQLISICKAYENRERILQTLSANIRKQQ